MTELPAMRLRSGTCIPLEEAANEMIFESLRGVTSHEAKSDVLTPWKERDRRDREVMAASGVVDQAVRRGMYHRKANPVQSHLNSRDGVAPPTRFTKATDPHSFIDGTLPGDD